MPRSVGSGRVDDDATTQALLAPFDRHVLLATGRAVHVRPAAAGDLSTLRSFYDRLGDASRFSRFFGVRVISDDELGRATVQAVQNEVTLVVESDGVIVGIGEYHVLPNGEEAEVAFAVADAHHHEGVATVLLEDLALVARAAGLRRLVAETLAGNAAMLGVFQTVGLVHRNWFEGGVVHVQLDLTADHLLQDDADMRDWRSAVRSLRSLVEPSHVVVFGAGQDPSSPGRAILGHLRDTFAGSVSVVDPWADSIGVHGAVRGFDELDGLPDLAIVAVPAPSVAAVVTQCGVAGVPIAVVVSAGFAELGDSGARAQDEVLAAARRHGMRLVGPNSLGVVSAACGLNATFTGQQFIPGGIAIASQSGGVGIAIAAEAQRRQVGISSFVSMGNKADVSGNDLLRLWVEDDHTNVILLYLESFGDPVRFARVARAVSQHKPVVALKSGGTASVTSVGSSDTAALTNDQVIVDALFAHTGVVRARTLEELIDLGLLFDRQPAPAGRRVALIGNAGGPLVLGADAANANGLEIPMLSTRLRDRIDRLAPAVVSSTNPVDLGVGISPDRLAAVVDAVGASGEVDACIVVCVELGEHRVLDDVASLLGAVALDRVPVVLSLICAGDRKACSLPVFPTPERAATAVALAAGRSVWQASIADDAGTEGTAEVGSASFVDVRRLARSHAGGSTSTTWLDPVVGFELLSGAGVPVADWRYAQSADRCERAADELGYPCVAKADVVDVAQSDTAGTARLGIRNHTMASNAYSAFVDEFGDRLRGVVIQTQQPDGLELLVGGIRDAVFGPFVVVGAGGPETELRDDRVVLVAPVSKSAARHAVESLRLAPLFHGFRGRPELPVEPVVDLVHRIGVLAASVPEIQQLELNPVLVGPDGCATVDAVIGVAAMRSQVVPVRAMRGRSATRPTT